MQNKSNLAVGTALAGSYAGVWSQQRSNALNSISYLVGTLQVSLSNCKTACMDTYVNVLTFALLLFPFTLL